MVADRGPAFARLREAMMHLVHPQAIAEAIAWANEQGITDDPDVTHALASFVESYLRGVSDRLEADWDAASGTEQERVAQMFDCSPLHPASERPANALLH